MNILRFLREQAKDYDCSECGANHSKSDIRLLGRLESAWMVRVTCGSCRTPFKLLVVVDESRGGLPATVKQDHPSAARRRPVSSDEVLDAHEFLSNWQGRLDDILTTTTPPAEASTERSAEPT
ncbi:hypothetical protein BH18CHL2_BH18CHL2_04750 [soil metagenome]